MKSDTIMHRLGLLRPQSKAGKSIEPETQQPVLAMRRTHRISWMVSSWFLTSDIAPGHGGTASLTIGCPDDFYAVRLGFANITPRPWHITKAIGCVSTSYSDYVHPSGEGNWTPFTMAGQGADENFIVTAADAPTEIAVAGNSAIAATGESALPAWTWTDWAPIRSTTPDPTTGMRVLMLRALVPSGQTICFANSQMRSVTGNKRLNQGFDYFIGGVKFDFDRVSHPHEQHNESTRIWQDNQIATGSLFPMVQFLTKNGGIVGATTGDSHQQGTTTTDQVTGYLYRATTRVGAAHVGKIPFGMVNLGVGGLTSGNFFRRLSMLLPATRPSYAVLPGWSYNDRTGLVHADQDAVDRFIAHLIEAAELCERHGTVPIFLTPFPRDAEKMTEVQMKPWLDLRHTILDMRSSGAIVVDTTPLLGQTTHGAFDGTYLASMSDDEMHPNDAGHTAVADALVPLLNAACL